ncbi:MAG: CHAT domain-containing protein [Candidatus Eisenbacteria bacterium]|uniref:CHAT domain-containing protein n=1 Tax=Eiseniibacteriota bacterium TaxID=2212470 RepID=A0A849SBI5_UNCEI|nr:CHAT domain-containing protein [Candidatus Eisenbacteria bacterium]
MLDSLGFAGLAALEAHPPASAPLRAELLGEVIESLLQGSMAREDSVVQLAKRAVAEAQALDSQTGSAAIVNAALRAARAYSIRSNAGDRDSCYAMLARARAQLSARTHRPNEDVDILGLELWAHLYLDDFRDVLRLAAIADSLCGVAGRCEPVTRFRIEVARARALMGNGQFASARASLELATRIRDAGGIRAEESMLLENQQASLEAFSGSNDRALEHIRRALAEASRLPPLRFRAISTVRQAASIHSSAGRFFESVQYAREAYDRVRTLLGEESATAAATRLSLGESLGHLGDYQTGLAEIRAALGTIERVQPNARGQRALALGMLSQTELRLGMAEEALNHAREAARLRSELMGLNHYFVAHTLGIVASALRQLERDEEARDTLLRVVEIEQRQGVSSQLTRGLAQLSETEMALGNATRALDLADRATAIADTLHGNGSVRYGEVAASRVAPLLAVGREPEAVAVALGVSGAEREQVRLASHALSEREALATESGRSWGYEYVMLAATHPGLEESAVRRLWNEVCLARSLVFRERSIQRAGSREASRSRLRARTDSSRAALAARLLQRPEGVSDSVWQADLLARRARVEQLERGLRASEGSEGRGTGPSGLDFSTAIPAGSALISFVRFHDTRLRGAATDERVGVLRYAAFVARDGRVRVFLLSRADALEPAIARFAALAFAPPAGDDARRREAQQQVVAAGVAVRKQIWDPLALALEGAQRIFVVPDGATAAVDLMTLPLDDGRFLAESGQAFERFTTEHDLTAPSGASPSATLLVVGAPDFEAGSKRRPAAQEQVAAHEGARGVPELWALPESKIEADTVFAMWRAGSKSHRPDLLLTGADAGERAVRSALEHCTMLHFATHAYRVGEAASPRGNDMSFRGVGGWEVADGASKRRVQRFDMRVVGLALAGARNLDEPAPPESDGWLTDEEVSSLDLNAVDCAVLSACHTGVFDAGQTESVQGLYRAFRLAGCRRVVMSLGPVNDEAARKWIVEFYRARLAGGSVASAARDASLSRLRELRQAGLLPHPSQWAVFVAAGARE